MLKIEITENTFRTINGTSKRTGQPFSINKQDAYLWLPGQKYPTPFQINLEQNQPAYQPGEYQVSPDSFYVDRYGSLAVNPKLVPLQARAVDPVKKSGTA